MTRPSRRRPFGALALAITLALSWNGRATAHDGHEQESPDAPHLAGNRRTWTHASGHYQVQGTFVATHGDQVQVRRENGEVLDIKREALSQPDRVWVERRLAGIRRLNSGADSLLLAAGAVQPGGEAGRPEPAVASAFRAFAETLKLRWDRDFVYVESDGMPDHRMMVGITAWQQQVPLPQSYNGANAWRIPLHPTPAKNPLSAKTHFFRGAIALAVNGIPIFNPIKNDGHTDTFLAGELDEYGGHCGRADDYHYHIAPVHLEPKVGKGKPLAYALDGYAIYGDDEPDGSKAARLDGFNGHNDAQHGYHYHATRTYPYLNGGFHGEVTERDGQVDPQPNAQPVRPALPPLRGAKITGFTSPKPGSYSLTYEIRGNTNSVNYTLTPNGGATFQYVDTAGKTTTESYQRSGRGPGGGPDDRPPPAADRRPPPPVIAALDLDGDRVLSADEIARSPRSLARLDLNKDGTVTAEEMRPPRPPGQDNPPPPRKKAGPGRGEAAKKARRPLPPEAAAIDLNNDGEFSAQEMARSSASLLKLDRDQDGTLSNEELRSAAPPDGPPPPEDGRRPPTDGEADPTPAPADFGPLVVTSPAFTPGGRYPVDFTCDGAGVSPPIAWNGVPEGTRSFALSVWHVPPPGGIKSYWVLYNIPADVTSLPRNTSGIGVGGLNDKRQTGYDPMCSQGPGLKTYHLTVYALSKELTLEPGQATRAGLLRAIADVTLAQKTLTYQYERTGRD